MAARPAAKAVSGSFRDKHNRVYEHETGIVRGISEVAASNWRAITAEPFLKEFLDKGYVVNTEFMNEPFHIWPEALRHRRIEPITYPYEWSFGMLKTAALFHLHLFSRSIENGWTLKDASAYNVQWVGSKPVFIDTVSFERYPDGAPWTAYRQFCMMFLFPLMINAYAGIDFRPLLRSSLDGISPATTRKVLGLCSIFKPGVLAHVVMHAKLERQAELQDAKEAKTLTEMSSLEVREVRQRRHTKGMVLGTIESLARLVRKLELPEGRTAWGNYSQEHSYSDVSFEAKREFVNRHCGERHRTVVWDIGCNTGTFSRIAASHADTVLAIDGDGLAIDRLFRELKREGNDKILPLVLDLTNLSPNQGWLGQERTSIDRRSKPELVLCLALIHHLVLTANIPLASVIAWLRSLNAELIIEYVDIADPMSQMLIRNKKHGHHELLEHDFLHAIKSHFAVSDSKVLKGGLRTLYFLRPI